MNIRELSLEDLELVAGGEPGDVDSYGGSWGGPDTSGGAPQGGVEVAPLPAPSTPETPYTCPVGNNTGCWGVPPGPSEGPMITPPGPEMGFPTPSTNAWC